MGGGHRGNRRDKNDYSKRPYKGHSKPSTNVSKERSDNKCDDSETRRNDKSRSRRQERSQYSRRERSGSDRSQRRPRPEAKKIPSLLKIDPGNPIFQQSPVVSQPDEGYSSNQQFAEPALGQAGPVGLGRGALLSEEVLQGLRSRGNQPRVSEN